MEKHKTRINGVINYHVYHAVKYCPFDGLFSGWFSVMAMSVGFNWLLMGS